MDATSWDIAVIGAGGTGSAAARFLAQSGHTVTVYERFTLDHDQGSSYGGSRIIRRTYPDPLYTRMMGAAYALWAALEREAGEDLFLCCGGLTFGRRDNPAMAATEASLRVNDVDFKTLSADEVSSRYPAFRLDADQYAIYQADSGLLRASRCVRAQMRLAAAAGAVLHEGMQIQTITQGSGGKIRVTHGDGAMEHDCVLVAAGPWMMELLPQLNLPLTVTRQYYAHLQPPTQPEQFEAKAFPVWIDADTNIYGFPHHDDLPGVKVAWHHPGMPVDPNAVPRDIRPEDSQPLLEYTARRLPSLVGPPVYEKTCLYTNAPDEDFIIDRVPELPGVYFCSGCSGHGFKFTILLGQMLANLALGNTLSCEIERFRCSRFLPRDV